MKKLKRKAKKLSNGDGKRAKNENFLLYDQNEDTFKIAANDGEDDDEEEETGEFENNTKKRASSISSNEAELLLKLKAVISKNKGSDEEYSE